MSKPSSLSIVSTRPPGILVDATAATDTDDDMTLPCAKLMQMKLEKEAINVPLRVSAAIHQLDGSFDLGENAQFLCHVQALRFRKILGTELQEGDEHAALIPQMLIEGEAAQGGFDHLTGFTFIQRIGMIEPAQRLHFLLQRGPKSFDQLQKGVQPLAAFSPLGGDMCIKRRTGHDGFADRAFGGMIRLSQPFTRDPE